MKHALKILCVLTCVTLAACGNGVVPNDESPSSENILLLSALLSAAGSNTPTAAQRLRGIWIVGGYDGSSVVNRTDLYDPETNTYFSDAAPGLTVPRSFLSLVSTGNRLYAIGGLTGAGVVAATVETLDITTAGASWTLAGNLVTARVAPSAVNVEGKLYVIGGSTTAVPALTASIEEFSGSSWSVPAYVSTGLVAGDQRLDGGIAATNGIVYLTGGRNATTGRITANNGWIRGADDAAAAVVVTAVTEPAMSAVVSNPNEQRWGCASEAATNVALQPTVFIVGGNATNPATNSYPVLRSAFTSPSSFVSSFASNATAFGTSYSMLSARVFPQAVTITTGSYPGLYVLGGATSAANVTGIEYLPISGAAIGTFTARATMANPRYGFGASKVSQ
jgi:hypothetical protein